MVIGAGIVGISTALWLQKGGHRVTLLDREGPAAGASFGNAGVLASGSIIPVTVPGLLKKAPKMLLDPNQPLFLRWGYVPKLLPFLFKYLKHANAKSVEHISGALHQLLYDAPEQHLALAKGTAAEEYIKTGNYLFGYKDKAAFEADSFGWNLRKKRKVPFEEMTAADLEAYDPNLKGRFGYGVLCKGHGQITDPGAYVTALAGQFEKNGGDLIIGNLKDFTIKDGHCTMAITDGEPIEADSFVLAMGAWSGELAAKLGIKVPLESERGYHVEFTNPSITFTSPLMVAAGKFVVSSMNGRLRCAGVVEFGGLETPASKAPFELLKRNVAALFPDLTYDETVEWMGHRPATTDSIPVIGKSPKAENILVGYGHHHIGLSGGPKTGRWLAEMVSGKTLNIDQTLYAPNRK